MPLSHRQRILVIQLGDLGDVILTEPCIAALREKYPTAKIYMVVRQKAVGLLKEFVGLDGYLGVCKKGLGIRKGWKCNRHFFKILRSWKIDTAIDLRTGNRGAYIAWASGAKERLGLSSLEKGHRDWFFTDYLTVDWNGLPDTYMGRLLLASLKPLGIDPIHSRVLPQLCVPEEALHRATQLLAQEKIPIGRMIALHPMSLWAYKEWTKEGWEYLIERLLEKNMTVVLTGDINDATRCEEIKEKFPGKIYSLAGKTPLSILSAVLSKCVCVIGVDTMTMHLARAVNVPTVTIFGPSLYSIWAPKDPRHLLVLPIYSCVPCGQKGCDGKERSKCLEELTGEFVWQTINKWPVFCDILQ